MLGITDYLWRLIPANPILLRVVESGGKRRRDLFIRCAYLGLLIFLVIFFLLGSSSQVTGNASLSELAKTSSNIFRSMSNLQLALVALLAPIFTAGAITQEKDSQTYDILLATPLTNGQIVFGSLLSRLFFVVALLVSGIPIFSITQIFGGVAIRSIALSFAIAASTAFVTGALAMAIATFKVGTRRTIFSFYLFIVLYLVGTWLLDQIPYFQIAGRSINPNQDSHISWFTGLNPFLALRVIFNDPTYAPPELGDLPANLQRWPLGWYLSNPASFYINFMFFLSVILVLPSIVMLRRVAQSTVSLKTWVLQKLHVSSGDRTRKPRTVWMNPIAWREAKTKASAARASLLRWGFIAGGIAGAVAMLIFFSTEEPYAKYVSATSYNPVTKQLSVFDGQRAVTYLLAPGFQLTVDRNDTEGKPKKDTFGPEYLASTGRMRVVAPERDLPATGGSLTGLEIAPIERRLTEATARQFLLGAVMIEFAVILLIVTNAAASTVTREKEDGSLDLLLTTPITSRYYIWGKLRGLVAFVLPLIAVPVASALLFVAYDTYRWLTGQAGSEFRWIVFPEAVLIMPGTLVIVVAFASILGMQMSLRCRTTVMAVMSSVGIVVGICATLGWCGMASLTNMGNAGPIGMIIGAFSPFTVLAVLINPYQFAERTFVEGTPDDQGAARITLFLFSWAAIGVYTAIVWSMYKGMVKNFDMTIRRQSR